MAKFKEKLVGTQLDPQYGWVVADPTKSQGFDPIGAAKKLYTTLYGKDSLHQDINNIKSIPKGRYNRNIVGMPDGETSDYKNYNNLLSWYYAATNPQYQSNSTYKQIVDLNARGLGKLTRASANDSLWGRSSGSNKGAFGDYYVTYRDPKAIRELQASFTRGNKDVQAAYRDMLLAGAVDPEQIYDTTKPSWMASPVPEGAREAIKYLKVQGGVPGGGFINGNSVAANGPVKNNPYRGFAGAAYLAGYDPNLYKDANLIRYFEGANPNLISPNGMPWMGVNDAKNVSWTGGGEFLTDEAFNYYKNRSQPGLFGNDWSNVGTNSNLLSGTFNGQRSFFTPYDYAIKGIPDEQAKVTNISATDPNFWAKQGSLQNFNNTWGFVTQQDPYAGLEASNIALQPDTLTAKLRYKSGGGGFLGGLIGSLPSLGLSLIPGVGPFASIASGIQGIGSVASFFDKDNQKGPGSWYQPSIYPNYIR